jgi:hypothetical protein
MRDPVGDITEAKSSGLRKNSRHSPGTLTEKSTYTRRHEQPGPIHDFPREALDDSAHGDKNWISKGKID